MIASDVKFNNSPLEEDKKPKRHKNHNKTELKKKRDEEEYDNKVKIQRHKQLMHLLNKSKFYSFHLNEIEDNKSKEKRTTRKRNKFPVNDENVPPVKKKSKKGDVEKYDIQEYISTEVSNEI